MDSSSGENSGIAWIVTLCLVEHGDECLCTTDAGTILLHSVPMYLRRLSTHYVKTRAVMSSPSQTRHKSGPQGQSAGAFAKQDHFAGLQQDQQVEGEVVMFDVVQVVLEFFDRIFVGSAIGIAQLRPAGDAGFY